MYEIIKLTEPLFMVIGTWLYFKSVLSIKPVYYNSQIVLYLLSITFIQVAFYYLLPIEFHSFGFMIGKVFTTGSLLFLFSGEVKRKVLLGLFFLWVLSFTLDNILLIALFWERKNDIMKIVSLVIFFINGLLFFNLNKNSKRDYSKDIGILAIQTMVVWICYIVSSIVVLQLDMSTDIFPYSELVVLILSKGLAVFFIIIFNILNVTNLENKEYYLQEQRHELLETYYRKTERYQKEVLDMRERMQQQLLTIEAAMSDDEFHLAEQEIDNFIGKLSSKENQHFTGHTGMNALINAKYSIASSEGITCDFHVRLPEELAIPTKDMTIVVGNILDNAIEACYYCTKEAFIQFKLMYHQKSIILFCENSTDGKVTTMKTRKKDRMNHGLGLKNVTRVVERYQGNVDIEWIDTKFQIELTMQNKE